MQPNNPAERSILTLHYTIAISSPFNADYDFEKVSLDTSSLNVEGLKEIRSFTFRSMGKPSDFEYGIIAEVTLEYLLKDNNEELKKSIEKHPSQGPLGVDKINHVGRMIIGLLDKLINYIAWRKNLEILHNHGQKKILNWEWRTDDQSGNYNDYIEEITKKPKYIIGGIYRVKGAGNYLDLKSEDFEEFYSLQKREVPVPLHQELLIEVSRLHHENLNRSAFLMLYVAFEVASKSLIGYKKPDAAWLINNVPSPDLRKIYDEFINKEIAVILDSEDLKVLRKFGNKRNDITHKGDFVDQETIERYFEHVKRWVRSIDYQFGYEWAKE